MAGYPSYTLAVGDGTVRTRTAHVLVAAAFIGPRPDGQVVRHHDDDPTNNHWTNLVYGTTAENIADMYRNQRALVGEASPKAKLTNEDVHLIRLGYVPGVTTAERIAERFGVSRAAVLLILRGENWKWLVTPGWSPVTIDGRKARWLKAVA